MNYYLDKISISDKQIKEIHIQIKILLTNIPSIYYTLASIILPEIVDVVHFKTPDRLLIFIEL